MFRGAHDDTVCSCSYIFAFSKIVLEVDVVAMMEMLVRTAFISQSPLIGIEIFVFGGIGVLFLV